MACSIVSNITLSGHVTLWRELTVRVPLCGVTRCSDAARMSLHIGTVFLGYSTPSFVKQSGLSPLYESQYLWVAYEIELSVLCFPASVCLLRPNLKLLFQSHVILDPL